MKLKKYKKTIFTFIFVLFTFYIIYWTISDDNYQEPKEEIKKVEKKKEKKEEKKETALNKVIIDIKGEIANPGVYELTDSNNVNDAINMAGGLTQKSDTSNINLSKKLVDEMVIIVYSKEEIKKMKESTEKICPPCNNACIEETDEKSKLNENSEAKPSSKININTASKEELLSLNGIGETKAEAIIEYRTKNGKYNSIEDIKNVSGIGEAAFEKIKDQITI